MRKGRNIIISAILALSAAGQSCASVAVSATVAQASDSAHVRGRLSTPHTLYHSMS